MSQQRRYLQRHPAAHTVRSVMDRPEQIRCPGEIIERQTKEDLLAKFPFREFRSNRRIYKGLLLIAFSKIVGFAVSPVTENLSM